ncbi:MAG: ComF family protein [Planctomycetes bacterium]|nr:ComF family protein [Planctomycetota bacterium]
MSALVDRTISAGSLMNFLTGTWSRARAATRRAMSGGIDLVFPPECALCQAPFEAARSPMLCGDCLVSLLGRAVPRCGRCGAQTAIATPVELGCGKCQRPLLHFDGAVVLGSYEAALRDAVLRCKGKHHQLLARALGELLAEQQLAEFSYWRLGAVVPIPMHWRRRLVRGANSPDSLAEAVSRRLGTRCIVHGVSRRRATLPQSRVNADQRRKNVQGAFRASASYDWRGARVLLVDDILTTGHTCNEVGRVLRDAGAEAIFVAIMARAQGNV